MKDLKEIREYWHKKYPHVHVTLWSNQNGDKYYGKMISPDRNENLAATTLGQLIAQGEAFLRRST